MPSTARDHQETGRPASETNARLQPDQLAGAADVPKYPRSRQGQGRLKEAGVAEGTEFDLCLSRGGCHRGGDGASSRSASSPGSTACSTPLPRERAQGQEAGRAQTGLNSVPDVSASPRTFVPTGPMTSQEPGQEMIEEATPHRPTSAGGLEKAMESIASEAFCVPRFRYANITPTRRLDRQADSDEIPQSSRPSGVSSHSQANPRAPPQRGCSVSRGLRGRVGGGQRHTPTLAHFCRTLNLSPLKSGERE